MVVRHRMPWRISRRRGNHSRYCRRRSCHRRSRNFRLRRPRVRGARRRESQHRCAPFVPRRCLHLHAALFCSRRTSRRRDRWRRVARLTRRLALRRRLPVAHSSSASCFCTRARQQYVGRCVAGAAIRNALGELQRRRPLSLPLRRLQLRRRGCHCWSTAVACKRNAAVVGAAAAKNTLLSDGPVLEDRLPLRLSRRRRLLLRLRLRLLLSFPRYHRHRPRQR